MPSNQDYVDRANLAIDHYDSGLELEEAVTDLVTDLRHLAAAEGLDWTKITDLAELHFEEENDA